MRGVADPGSPVNVQASVIFSRATGFARVQRHSDRQRGVFRPAVLREFALRARGRSNAIGRAAEGNKKCVSIGTDFIATVLCQRSAQNGVVFGKNSWIPIAQPPQQLGRTLNVGKEKCDCACWCGEHIQMNLVGRFLRQANAAMPIISRFVCEPSQTRSCRNRPRSKKPVSR